MTGHEHESRQFGRNREYNTLDSRYPAESPMDSSTLYEENMQGSNSRYHGKSLLPGGGPANPENVLQKRSDEELGCHGTGRLEEGQQVHKAHPAYSFETPRQESSVGGQISHNRVQVDSSSSSSGSENEVSDHEQNRDHSSEEYMSDKDNDDREYMSDDDGHHDHHQHQYYMNESTRDAVAAQAVVAQEMSNVQVMKRLSIGGGVSSLDPDLPQGLSGAHPFDFDGQTCNGVGRLSPTGSPTDEEADGVVHNMQLREVGSNDTTTIDSSGDDAIYGETQSNSNQATETKRQSQLYRSNSAGNASRPPVDPALSSQLLWVPATVHPELAPQEWKSFVQHKVAEIRERVRNSSQDEGTTGEGKRRSLGRSRTVTGASTVDGSMGDRLGGSTSLGRKNSKLSRQIGSESEYTDGSDVLAERRKSAGSDRQELSTPSIKRLSSQLRALGELESLAMNPFELARSLSMPASLQTTGSETSETGLPIGALTTTIAQSIENHDDRRGNVLPVPPKDEYLQQARDTSLPQRSASTGETGSHDHPTNNEAYTEENPLFLAETTNTLKRSTRTTRVSGRSRPSNRPQRPKPKPNLAALDIAKANDVTQQRPQDSPMSASSASSTIGSPGSDEMFSPVESKERISSPANEPRNAEAVTSGKPASGVRNRPLSPVQESTRESLDEAMARQQQTTPSVVAQEKVAAAGATSPPMPSRYLHGRHNRSRYTGDINFEGLAGQGPAAEGSGEERDGQITQGHLINQIDSKERELREREREAEGREKEVTAGPTHDTSTQLKPLPISTNKSAEHASPSGQSLAAYQTLSKTKTKDDRSPSEVISTIRNDGRPPSPSSSSAIKPKKNTWKWLLGGVGSSSSNGNSNSNSNVDDSTVDSGLMSMKQSTPVAGDVMFEANGVVPVLSASSVGSSSNNKERDMASSHQHSTMGGHNKENHRETSHRDTVASSPTSDKKGFASLFKKKKKEPEEEKTPVTVATSMAALDEKRQARAQTRYRSKHGSSVSVSPNRRMSPQRDGSKAHHGSSGDGNMHGNVKDAANGGNQRQNGGGASPDAAGSGSTSQLTKAEQQQAQSEGLPYHIPAHQMSDRSLIMQYHRFPLHVERAIYRLSHMKLANPRRPLVQQVLLSNFMYAYLNLINHGYQQQQLQQQQQQQQLQQQQYQNQRQMDLHSRHNSQPNQNQKDSKQKEKQKQFKPKQSSSSSASSSRYKGRYGRKYGASSANALHLSHDSTSSSSSSSTTADGDENLWEEE